MSNKILCNVKKSPFARAKRVFLIANMYFFEYNKRKLMGK